jgi:hypothetical protein
MTMNIERWIIQERHTLSIPGCKLIVSGLPDFLRSSGSGTGSTHGIRHTDHVAPSIRKEAGTNFADKRHLLGWYSSLANSDRGVLLNVIYEESE